MSFYYPISIHGIILLLLGFQISAIKGICSTYPYCDVCETGGPGCASCINPGEYGLLASGLGCASCSSNEHCFSCTSLTLCEQCDSVVFGPVFNLSGRCEPCANHCGYCVLSGAGKCDNGNCDLGYGFNTTESTCQSCAMNCLSCSFSGPGLCDTCLIGQGLTSSAGTPPQDCKNCTEANCVDCYANYAVCIQCADDYVLTPQGKCQSTLSTAATTTAVNGITTSVATTTAATSTTVPTTTKTTTTTTGGTTSVTKTESSSTTTPVTTTKTTATTTISVTSTKPPTTSTSTVSTASISITSAANMAPSSTTTSTTMAEASSQTTKAYSETSNIGSEAATISSSSDGPETTTEKKDNLTDEQKIWIIVGVSVGSVAAIIFIGTLCWVCMTPNEVPLMMTVRRMAVRDYISPRLVPWGYRRPPVGNPRYVPWSYRLPPPEPARSRPRMMRGYSYSPSRQFIPSQMAHRFNPQRGFIDYGFTGLKM